MSDVVPFQKKQPLHNLRAVLDGYLTHLERKGANNWNMCDTTAFAMCSNIVEAVKKDGWVL